MWFPGTIKRTTLLSVRGALNCVESFGSSILFFREFTGSCRWLLCVFLVCLIGPIHLKLIAMVHVPVQVWLGPTHSYWNQTMEEPEWILYIYDLYINVYICIFTYMYIYIYIYIMCVKVKLGCFILFWMICSQLLAYALQGWLISWNRKIFPIFSFVQAVCQLHS